jgi:hypothetical protein
MINGGYILILFSIGVLCWVLIPSRWFFFQNKVRYVYNIIDNMGNETSFELVPNKILLDKEDFLSIIQIKLKRYPDSTNYDFIAFDTYEGWHIKKSCTKKFIIEEIKKKYNELKELDFKNEIEKNNIRMETKEFVEKFWCQLNN